MKRYLIIVAALASLAPLAATAKSYSYHAPRSTYSAPKVRQAPYAGYGSASKANGLPRVKTTNGYIKRDGTYVNPYARSK